MRIGVTGAEGFIGGHVVRALQSDGSVSPKEFLGDINDIETTTDFVEDLDVVVHLAGENRASDSTIIRSNTLGVMSLLEVIRRENPGARLIIASSFQVYRQWGNPGPIDESLPPDPVSIYGLSKAFAEELCRRYSADHGLDIVVMRLSNVFGPGCRPDYNSVIATFIDRALSGQTIRINGDGSSLRDYIYIDDVVKSFIAASKADHDARFDIYNICSGAMHSLRDIVSHIAAHLDAPVDVEYSKESREDHVYDPCSNEKAIRDGIIVPPMAAFEKAIRHTISAESKGRGPASS